jgi:tetratricopeptide (TPR) repeat protein
MQPEDSPVAEAENLPDADQPVLVEAVAVVDEVPTSALEDAVVQDGGSAESDPGISSALPDEPVAAEIAANLKSPGELDLKNAHIWNELGNILTKANNADDAIDAYNKAIELEPEFGWPYSNLGLAHAQKGHFGEAIPLYQKSIELFDNSKDKAISWNRLGDAYRQLNEYDNAIAAYQIADELNQNYSIPNLREATVSQAFPIFSYLYGASNDRV